MAEEEQLYLTAKQIKTLKLLLNEKHYSHTHRNNIDDDDGAWTRAFKRLIFMPSGEFSISRMVMIVSFTYAIGIGLTGLLIYIFSGRVDLQTGKVIDRIILPDNLYNYSIALTGGGILQYGFTKAKAIIDQKSQQDSSTPIVNEAS